MIEPNETGGTAMTLPHRTYLLVATVLAWGALALQLHLTLSLSATNGMSTTGGIVRFFSYFTVTTNTLAAITFTSVLLARNTMRRPFFARPGVIAAVTMYMIVVGITYSLLLRSTWNPVGLQLVADRLLHDVMPIVMVAYWLVFVTRGSLHWRMIGWWLVYPIAYLVYSLAAGPVSGFYPYPFIDVTVLGYPRTLANSAALAVAFTVLASLMIGADSYMGRVRSSR
jgi:hypothetical protein